MPYKIVQTIERGKTTLVIVPSLWEENGNLWWPPKKSQFKLMKNELSEPNKSEWRVMTCVLKRPNIRTYELAEAELSIMEENSDTDCGLAPPQPVFQQEFEVMANKLNCIQENQSNTHTEYSNTNQENVMEIIGTDILNVEEIVAYMKGLSEKMDTMIQIQGVVMENQQKIIQKLATQSVQIDEILQMTVRNDGLSVTLLKDMSNTEETESFTLKPIENQRELISLDQFLADKGNRNKYKKQLSFLCSASSGEGKTCAYKLQEILFTRDFLCNCSWAGGSRGEKSKIALKDYKNVLKFFHGMIHTWDPTYTVQDNESFFKIITKNSKQRQSMKNLRLSSKRIRKNKKKLRQNSEIKPNDKNNGTGNETNKLQEIALNSGSGENMQKEEEPKGMVMCDDGIEDGLC